MSCNKTQKKLCQNDECKLCFDRSFASSSKARCFDIIKNKTVPRLVYASSSKKYWFVCDKCPHTYEKSTCNALKSGCPYCCVPQQKLCSSPDCSHCFDKSFASSEYSNLFDVENNGGLTSRDIFKHTSKKYKFRCDKCNHTFESRADHVANGHICPYCCIPSKTLCNDDECRQCFSKSFASSPMIKMFSNDNKGVNPRKIFKSSGEKYWFDCEYGHKYKASLDKIASGRRCPSCKNKTETLLYEFLSTLPYGEILTQYRLENCKNTLTNRSLPFDFALLDEKVIIELDGGQHFENVKYFKSDVKDRVYMDIFKQKCAISAGFSFFRIPQGYYFDIKTRATIQEWITCNVYTRKAKVYYYNPPDNSHLYDRHREIDEIFDLMTIEW